MLVRRARLVWLLLSLIAIAAAVWWFRLIDPAFTLPPIDRIVVDKSERRMELYSGGKLVREISGLALGDAPVGQKHFEGDEKTPEGTYKIDFRNPQSSYHLSLRISYPDEPAKQHAAAQGRSPGGEIYLHGQPNGLNLGRLRGDWTDGCVALSNRQIEALWNAVPIGTTVEIRP